MSDQDEAPHVTVQAGAASAAGAVAQQEPAPQGAVADEGDEG